MKKLLLLLSLLSLFVACVQKEAAKTTKPLSESNRLIDGVKISSVKSLSKKSLGSHENYALTIKKSSFGELFLMSSALIQSIPNPTGNHLNEKVVYFKKNGNTVGLFELTDGRYESSAIRTEVLLTTFPILSESEESIVLDFNKGMSKLFYTDNTYTSDFAQGSDGEQTVYSISDSFVDRAEIVGTALYVDQLIRLSLIENGNQQNVALRVKYNFQSYTYNSQFPSKLSSMMNRVGYFEVNPLIEAGTTERSVMIAKWDIEKPITFYISRNTPADYVQPITDAILYWNIVFKEAVGKEPLRVEMLPEGVDIYTPGYNIIQWMDNDAAGAAYADLQADPLTGEITRAHVYMPSTFATGATSDAYDRLMNLVANQKSASKKADFGLKFFSSSRIEESYNLAERMTESDVELKNLLASAQEDKENGGFDVDALIKRFRDDALRETVSHEVGHCLGLRHNFAGSTYTNLNKNNIKQIGTQFFLSGQIPNGVKYGSSIMDYNAPLFANMIGANIRLKGRALLHDKEAIRWGYSSAKLSDIKGGVFCTDSHFLAGIYKDCKQFDQLKTAVEGSFLAHDEIVKSIPLMLANAYSDIIEAQIPDKVPYLKQVTLNPMSVSNYLMRAFSKITDALSPTAQSINLLQSFGSVNYYNKNDYFEATANFKRQGINALGGLAKVMFADYRPMMNNDGLTISLVENMKEIFKKNIENLYGAKITDEERAAITEGSNRFFKALALELLTGHTTLMNNSTFFEVDENFPATVGLHLEMILFTEGSEVLLRSSDANKVVLKPAITSANLRAQAVLMCKHNFFPTEASYETDVAQLSYGFWSRHSENMTAINAILSEGTASRSARNWVAEEEKRFAPLNPKN